MTRSYLRTGVACAAMAFTGLAAAPALATDSGRTRIVTVGVGPQVTPQFIGADDLRISPMPIFDIRDEGDPLPFETADEGIGFGLLGDGRVFNFGPSIQIQNERDSDNAGTPIGDIDTSVELGAFVEFNPAPWVRFRLEGRKAVSGHEGLNGDVMLDFIYRSDTTVLSIGPRLRISDSDFQQAYFGVTPAQRLATGLPVFAADGGVHAVGITSSIHHQFNERWGIYGYAGYDRLVGDAEDSPFVRTFGSTDQFSAGLGLHYSFRIGGR